jgi:hypothetical protein
MTAAIIAAAVGDPVVETIANSGAFGAGFHDTDRSSVIPALVAGAILALVLAGVRALSVLRYGSALHRGSSPVERATAPHVSPLRDLPIVLAMQFATLFTMESAEQLASGRRLLGGLAWLGGPIVFSIAMHGLIGSACILILTAFARALYRTVASFVRETIEAILYSLERDTARASFKRRECVALARAQAPHVRQIGGRAPPSLPFAA